MVSMSKASTDAASQGVPLDPECPVGTPWCVEHDAGDDGEVRCEGPVFTSGDSWGGAVGIGTVDDGGVVAMLVRLSVRSDSLRTPDGLRNLSVLAARDLVATTRLAESSGLALSGMESDAARVLAAVLHHLNGAG